MVKLDKLPDDLVSDDEDKYKKSDSEFTDNSSSTISRDLNEELLSLFGGLERIVDSQDKEDAQVSQPYPSTFTLVKIRKSSHVRNPEMKMKAAYQT